MRFLNKITFACIILSFAFTSQNFAQKEKEEEKVKKVNFGYSTNPPLKKSKKKKENLKPNTPKNVDNELRILTVDATTAENSETENSIDTEKNKVKAVSIANKTREVAKKISRAKLSRTEIYQVGAGDVLYINLQNITAKYYTVLVDGTIDYPLAGKMVSVIDLTTDEIEDLLRDKIKLYKNPQVTVKVREYVSHRIKVVGLARAGDHFLQREAIPLDVIKTMVGAENDAKKVIVERQNDEPKIISLSSDELSSFLIQSGDKLTFAKGDEPASKKGETFSTQYYFLGDKICEGGKKKFHSGITLVQAVFNACGGLNTKLQNVKIIRKTASGKFISKNYNFKDILNGDETDPKLQANDLIDSDK